MAARAVKYILLVFITAGCVSTAGFTTATPCLSASGGHLLSADLFSHSPLFQSLHDQIVRLLVING
jgi:hypothetical protein